MSRQSRTREQLLGQIAELQAQLDEAQDTLRAIREGEVDAIVVSGQGGNQVYSLVGTESIYRLIVQTMKEAAFTATFDGRILFCNAQFGKFIKRPSEQVIGHLLGDFVDEDNADAASLLLAEARHQTVRQRLVFRAYDGTSVPAHISANLLNQPDGLSICVVASDLTELENSTELIQQLRTQQDSLQAAIEELAATEEELRVQNEQLSASRFEVEQTRARYEDLFETAPDGYVVTDPEGTIQEVNLAAARLLGLAASQLKGNPFSALLPAAARDGYLEVLAALNAAATPLHKKWEVEMRSMGGGPFWADVKAAASRDEEGRIVGLRWLMRDVTDRRRAEEALRQTTEDLERSNADLEQFAYVASHDLQEPLRAVRGFLELLREEQAGKLDGRGQEYIRFAVDGADRMTGMISDLLAYARVGTNAEPFAPVDLREVVEYVKSNLRSAIEESDAVITHDPLPTVVANPSDLRQVFQNLIGNALKFRAQGRRPEIHIAVRAEASGWVIGVRDNGIGVDSGQTTRVFQLFQRLHTRDRYPGTGIGLAICKKVIERHHGRIWVESGQREGASFFFSLPHLPQE